MAVTLNPLFSKHGFKGPGFTVDNEGNVTVKSLSSEVLISTIVDNTPDTSTVTTYAITEETDGFGVDGTGGNPTITVVKGRTYKFTLDLTALSFNIRNADGDVTSGISHTEDGTTVSGSEAQNKQSGTVEWTVPTTGTGFFYADIDGDPQGTFTVTEPEVTGTGTFSSLIVTGTSELRGDVTINADVDLNALLKVDNTTESTSTSNGALTVEGGAGIKKNLNVGGNIVGNTFLNTDVGVPTLSSNSNLNLSASNSIVVLIDDVEQGRITTLGSNIPVRDTTINDTIIGNAEPALATFTDASTVNDPTRGDHLTRKDYVDQRDIIFSVVFGA